MLKVLNLYAGIGGNRKLWEDVEVTAVEMNPKIGAIYKDFFPNDNVVIGDAHQYLLDHFGEYDFIWSSPPCPTHSKINLANSISPYKDNTAQLKHGGGIKVRYSDLKLYEEIILLKHFYKGKYCVENVISYYEPLIRPQELHRHYFWANSHIQYIKLECDKIEKEGDKTRSKRLGFDIACYKTDVRKDKILRNCVNPHVGLHILKESKREVHQDLFK